MGSRVLLASSAHTAGPPYFFQCIPPTFPDLPSQAQPGLLQLPDDLGEKSGERSVMARWLHDYLGLGIFTCKMEIIHVLPSAQSFGKEQM